MNKNAKPMNAFITEHGLVNVKASFSRIMRKLLRDFSNVDNYIDDILIHTSSFEDHFSAPEEVLNNFDSTTSRHNQQSAV